MSSRLLMRKMSTVASAASSKSGRRKLRVAVTQMTSSNDAEENLKTCEMLVERAAEMKADLVCLPENASFLGASMDESKAFAEPLSSPLLERYKKVAAAHRVWVSISGWKESAPRDSGDVGDRMYNTHLMISPEGTVDSVYRKTHLFDCPKVGLFESKSTAPGNELVLFRDGVFEDFPVGLTTCYDVRFPSVYTALRDAGAKVLLVPSDFTVVTGMAHWEVLLRARAIETQCYVVAAAQAGKHPPGERTSFGRALIVDPWGAVVAQCSSGSSPSVAVCDLDLDYIEEVRSSMPVRTHVRRDSEGLYAASNVTPGKL